MWAWEVIFRNGSGEVASTRNVFHRDAGGDGDFVPECLVQGIFAQDAFRSFPVKNGDAPMQAKVDLQLTDLIRMGESEIAPRCQEIRDLANTNAAGLAAFGTTATEITALQTAITTTARW